MHMSITDTSFPGHCITTSKHTIVYTDVASVEASSKRNAELVIVVDL